MSKKKKKSKTIKKENSGSFSSVSVSLAKSIKQEFPGVLAGKDSVLLLLWLGSFPGPGTSVHAVGATKIGKKGEFPLWLSRS